MDVHSRKILALLQKDASLSVDQISDAIGLSRTPCWKRIKELEDDGTIKARVALVDPKKIGLGIVVFVSITTESHDIEWLNKFTKTVSDIPEVIGFYRMAGEVDYLLKLALRDIEDYDRIYKKIISVSGCRTVSAHFAMEELKFTTEYPI